MNNSQSEKLLKILFIITRGEQGGAQRYVYDLATNLPSDQFQILTVMGPEKLALQKKLESQKIAVNIAKKLVRGIHPLKNLLAVWELRNIIKNYQPDIIHLNSSMAGIVGSFAAVLAGANNVIFTAHGFAFLEPHSFLVRKFYFWVEKIASKFRQKIICVSEYDRREAIKAGLCSAEKLITIHNGINLQQIQTPTSYKPQANSWTIGTIANLYPTKGLKYLIDAAKILNLKSKILNLKFLIIGEGPERSYLESRIKNHGLEKNFMLQGALPNALEHLPEFDIFVSSSVKEGFPYTILEAMTAGLPIVATSVGGIPEIISPSFYPSPLAGEGGRRPGEGAKGCGILIPPKDPQALAEAIKLLFDNLSLAQTLGQNAQAKVREFSLEKMLQKTTKVYQEILAA